MYYYIDINVLGLTPDHNIPAVYFGHSNDILGKKQ